MEITHGWGPHWHWFWVVPFLLMILMCTLAARASRRRGAWGGCCGSRFAGRRSAGWNVESDDTDRRQPETALQVLDLRYARGEITRDEYERMKGDIEPRPAAE